MPTDSIFLPVLPKPAVRAILRAPSPMSETFAPSPHDRSPGGFLPVVLILLTFALFSTVVAWILHLAGPVEDVEAKRAVERVEFLHKVRSRDTEALNSYGLADPATGLTRIPIQRAAELAVDRLKAKPVRPADLIPPLPAVAPGAAGAKEGPPPAPAAPLPSVAPGAKEGVAPVTPPPTSPPATKAPKTT